MDKPKIIMDSWEGRHNTDLDSAANRLVKSRSYKDLSTICIIPTRGLIHVRVVQSWLSMMQPMNQKFMRMFITGMKVGQVYSAAIEQIQAHPELSTWPYILTLEEDNLPPPDGLLKLYESIEKYDVVGGLYWTKGEGGQPMIYGNPMDMPMTFVPQIPIVDGLQPANGLGMGFNLFKASIFKDPKLPKPWFKTLQEYIAGQGAKAYTQDLYFYENIKKLGYKVACDTRVKVGHFDVNTDIVW